ncbi:hypothetical protein EZV62_011729 [Acer yangbiense]|uniref:Phytocyanin domain-containing protein n=1 Tax=Acer yangbiense TaxID=1000413 RepID=A0A5C7I6I0_9ROSI|nr:hypothetical protein EZV62_011729 [Acer yangbiense]
MCTILVFCDFIHTGIIVVGARSFCSNDSHRWGLIWLEFFVVPHQIMGGKQNIPCRGFNSLLTINVYCAVFIYEPPLSVLVVNREAYLNCNTQNYIAMYVDGQTNLELRHPGPQYFIGGKDYCKTGVKLEIVVLPELPS